MRFLAILAAFLTTLLIATPVFATDTPYSFTTTSTCASTSTQAWTTIAPQANNNFGFGANDKLEMVNDSDFNGQQVASVIFYLCGYTTDSTADSNPINFGIGNLATGTLSQVIGTITFDSIVHCNPSTNCGSVSPTAVSVGLSSGFDTIGDSESNGIAITFTTSSTTNHAVEDICTGSSSCTNPLSNGGLCENTYSASNCSQHKALVGTITFGSQIQPTGGSVSIVPTPYNILLTAEIVATIVIIAVAVAIATKRS